ncbi:MAG: hypothetical protein H6861_08665 [Rhodospirillales bacterium]|nr:hypothetical protein [Rhodospirillales bacterium]
MPKLVLCFSILFLLSACASNIQHYGQIDHNQKTVTVPAGAQGLKGDIKKALNAEGWKMVVYKGPSVMQGSLGENTRLEKFDTFNTRYTLVMDSNQFDYCLTFSPMIRYEISLIDNETGSEVITMDGQGCEDQVAKQFAQALKGQ